MTAFVLLVEGEHQQEGVLQYATLLYPLRIAELGEVGGDLRTYTPELPRERSRELRIDLGLPKVEILEIVFVRITAFMR